MINLYFLHEISKDKSGKPQTLRLALVIFALAALILIAGKILIRVLEALGF